MLFEPVPLARDGSTETIKFGVDVSDQADSANAIMDEPEGPTKKQQYHRDPSSWEQGATPVVKAYRNQDFLNSSHARHLRILAEYEETMQRLSANVCATRVCQIRRGCGPAAAAWLTRASMITGCACNHPIFWLGSLQGPPAV